MNDGNAPPGSILIRFVSGPLAGQTYPVQKPTITIGRSETNDIVVRNDQHVSRVHARLRWLNNAWSIEKLAPQNTLTVNRQPVQQAAISHNATIGLSTDTSFLFLVESNVSATPVPRLPTNPAAFPPPQPTSPNALTPVPDASACGQPDTRTDDRPEHTPG